MTEEQAFSSEDKIWDMFKNYTYIYSVRFDIYICVCVYVYAYVIHRNNYCQGLHNPGSVWCTGPRTPAPDLAHDFLHELGKSLRPDPVEYLLDLKFKFSDLGT